MKLSRMVCLVLLILSFAFMSCGGKDEGNSDCAEFNPPAKDKYYGQSCNTFMYGTCPTKFSDCAEGSCEFTYNAEICSKTCSTNADCPSGLYCKQYNSKMTCTTPCTSHTYCDGYMCCNYYQDPNDPTQCLQGTCY